MNIHKSMDNWRLLSIKTWISINGNLFFTDIHCGMSLHGYPCLDINVDIHACMDNWRMTSKNHGYPCWYPWIFGNPCMDLLWILGPGKGAGALHCIRNVIWTSSNNPGAMLHSSCRVTSWLVGFCSVTFGYNQLRHVMWSDFQVRLFCCCGSSMCGEESWRTASNGGKLSAFK